MKDYSYVTSTEQLFDLILFYKRLKKEKEVKYLKKLYRKAIKKEKNYIKCIKCGKYFGTLIKLKSGVYAHKECI